MSKYEKMAEVLASFDDLPGDAVVSARVVAALTGLSAATVWRLRRAGKLEAVKISEGRTGYRVASVRALLGLSEAA